MNKSSSHINAGTAENQQPLIGDNHLQNLSKTGSFLSHLARDLSGGRASSSSTASGLPAMKSSSRNNSSGSNNSSGTGGRRIMRKQQQLSVSESSVCEEAREIDDHQNKSASGAAAATATAMAVAATLQSHQQPTPPVPAIITTDASNEIEAKTVKRN